MTINIENLLSSDGFTPVNKYLAKQLGFLAAGFLGELIRQRKRFGQEQFYFTQEDMENEIGISVFQQREIIKKLIELNLISIEKKGIPYKNWYIINDENIFSLFNIQIRCKETGQQDKWLDSQTQRNLTTGYKETRLPDTKKLDHYSNKNKEIKKEIKITEKNFSFLPPAVSGYHLVDEENDSKSTLDDTKLLLDNTKNKNINTSVVNIKIEEIKKSIEQRQKINYSRGDVNDYYMAVCKLSSNLDDRLEIVKQAIAHNRKDFYPLKNPKDKFHRKGVFENCTFELEDIDEIQELFNKWRVLDKTDRGPEWERLYNSTDPEEKKQLKIIKTISRYLDNKSNN